MSSQYEYKVDGPKRALAAHEDLPAPAHGHAQGRRHPRSVSFSRRHMPGAASRSPGHRTGASPSRSALRSRSRHDRHSEISSESSDEDDLLPASVQSFHTAYRSAISIADSGLYLTVPAEWKSAADVAKDVYKLWTQIDDFAKHFRPPAATSDTDPLEALLLNKQHAQTVRYIGCLALATKDGLADWRRLLTERRSFQALVSACIGQSLLEHVFDQPWIGVDSESEELFAVSDRDAQEVDAFFRRGQHALHSEQCNEGAASMRSPQLQAFKIATFRLSARIWRLLEPLYQLGQSSHESGKWPSKKLMLGLHSIVETAAHLSRQMRLYPLCIFEWIPAGKGLKFNPDSMEAVNVGEMLETSPYIKQPDARRAVLREGADSEHTQPLSLVAIYPGLRIHFREHGPPVHNLEDRQGPMDYECEMATQLICRSVVLLQWGKVSLAVELMGDGTWREAAEKGDLSEFAKDREGCVELGELFLHIHGRDAFER